MIGRHFSSARSTSSKGRKVIERICGRVFCHDVDGGGNPVTIFSSYENLSSTTKQGLAKQCDWESVFISRRHHHLLEGDQKNSDDIKLPQLSFYMPSGDEVSFCAHAAMGACLELGTDENGDEIDDIEFVTTMPTTSTTDDCVEEDNNTIYSATIYEGDIVALEMDSVPFVEDRINNMPTVFRILRDFCNIEINSLTQDKINNPHNVSNNPLQSTMCNASIARPKTLIYMNSLETLHSAKAPKANSTAFQKACDALKGDGVDSEGSTGIYLYAKREEDDSWEARQFPRSSGYPEDPATGIAAAALVCSFYNNGVILPSYKIYQGTAMEKSSLIVVDNVEMTSASQSLNESENNEDGSNSNANQQASFRILGRVEVDERDSIEVSE